jgi:hypothetical protein
MDLIRVGEGGAVVARGECTCYRALGCAGGAPVIRRSAERAAHLVIGRSAERAAHLLSDVQLRRRRTCYRTLSRAEFELK